jgi:23S rRNA A2030 N6-methylase RlmJ
MIGGPAAYPGSPAVARALLGDNDRMTLMELHPPSTPRSKQAMGAERTSPCTSATGMRGCAR